MAAPSRVCAAFWPAISAGFLSALGRIVGSRNGRIFAPALSSASKIAATARSGSTTTVLPLSSASAPSNAARSCSRTPLPRCWRTSGPIFSDADEQVGGAVGVDQRIGERDRRVGDVGTADVERPGDGIERGQNRRVGVMLDQPVADLGALLGRRLARILVRLDDKMRFRGFGPVAPDFVDRVALDGDEHGAAAGKRFLRLLHPVAGVQPGVVADARALGRMFLEPLRGARLGHRLIAPLAVDLAAHLQRVASVDEDRRLLGKHHRRAGRALEAGQPSEALGVAPDIFAHMLVGERDDEPVELLGLELLAEGLEAVCIGGHGRLTPLPLS